MSRETQVRTLVSGYHYTRKRILEDAKRASIERKIRRGAGVEVGPDWEIWNAPRPLYGHLTWTGPFITGILYAAIDPDDNYAEEYREENRRLDARLLQWVSYEEAKAKVEWYYTELIEAGEIEIDDFSEGDIMRSYFRVRDNDEPYVLKRRKEE